MDFKSTALPVEASPPRSNYHTVTRHGLASTSPRTIGHHFRTNGYPGGTTLCSSNLTRVSVRTVDGTVYLTGIVDSPEQQARAVEIASRVPGVKNVVNQVQVAQK